MAESRAMNSSPPPKGLFRKIVPCSLSQNSYLTSNPSHFLVQRQRAQLSHKSPFLPLASPHSTLGSLGHNVQDAVGPEPVHPPVHPPAW